MEPNRIGVEYRKCCTYTPMEPLGDPDAQSYWIVQLPWSAEWGDNGLAYLAVEEGQGGWVHHPWSNVLVKELQARWLGFLYPGSIGLEGHLMLALIGLRRIRWIIIPEKHVLPF